MVVVAGFCCDAETMRTWLSFCFLVPATSGWAEDPATYARTSIDGMATATDT